MLSKKHRSSKKTIDKIFKQGRVFGSPCLTLRFFIEKDITPPKVSVIAPKSISKLAVRRNSLRRRGYRALRKYINKLPKGFKGVLTFRRPEENVLTIENEIENMFNKIY